MAKHENPQRPAEIFYPPGHPKHRPQTPPPGIKPPTQVEQTAASAQTETAPEDLGDVIRAIGDMAAELHEAFFAVPDVAEPSGRVDPEKFDGATRYAFVACGNALDYAIRLVSEQGRALRIKKLRRELADEMRAAGITGDPADGESVS